ncbi:hypothetical protein QQS21_003413 [Conoideocrella luteorostrata]|uniref:Uncharacterized protein n=1 Tax=Conoideocrella luteorostrata TaxID=1105319 RepID=A0AAJ0CW29_9HYPO|nr:hypothetical protein QQS21_003413 [Conoideocrella luteorostrata]
MASPEPGTSPTTSQPTATVVGAPVPIRPSSIITSTTATNGVLPPLTTPWTSPLSCTWTYVVNHPDETATPGAVAFLDLEPMPGDKTLSCYPNSMFSFGRTGVFSPGTCPDGWTTATALSDDVAAATTTAICCSFGYTLSGSACRRSVATALAVPITYNTTAGTYNVLTRSTTTLYSALLAVSTIQVQFGDDDKKRLGISPSKGYQEFSLSLGTRIGIAVGVCAFVLLCLGLICFGLARRRRAREGLTKERLMRDLKTIHRRGPSGNGSYNGDPSMSTVSSGPHFAHEQREPPPAYDPGRTRRISGNRQSDHGGQRDGEIRVLNEQKAVIQQRLDELEGPEVSQDELRAGR